MGIVVPVLTLVFLLLTRVSHAGSTSRKIIVGGSVASWKVPDSPNNTLNHWAEKNRFKVGDVLVWKYDRKIDSVLEVTQADYDSCNTAKPLKKYDNGDTKVKLDKSGAYFFISGAPGHCAKGEKLTLVVLSERKPDGGSHAGNPPKPKVSPVSPPAKAPAKAPTPAPTPTPTPAPTPAPAPAPAKNAAVGLNVGSGLFLTAVAIGLALA